MASFYLDQYSSESIQSQWIKHLQTEAYIYEISDVIAQNRGELQKVFENSSSEQIETINKVCGNLEEGFEIIDSHLADIKFELGEIKDELNSIASLLDWGFSALLEQLRVTNTLLGKIEKLLRIPDSQKERIYYIEQGLKYLKNAILEGCDSEFYNDALESFKKAEKIEKKDFIVTNRIGQIYLYSTRHLDFSLAKDYFLMSAREAMAEANIEGTPTSLNLSPAGYETLHYSHNVYLLAAAEAYLYAGRSCYLLQDLSNAIKYSGKGYALIPEFVEAGFEQSKYFATQNQYDEAVKILKTVIKKDRYYSVKTISDRDLFSHSPIRKLLDEFTLEAIDISKEKFVEYKNNLIANSSATGVLNMIEEEIEKNSFLSCMKAFDMLNGEYQLPSFKYFIPQGSYNIKKYAIYAKVVNNIIELEEHIIKEKNSLTELKDLRLQMRDRITNDFISTGFFSGLGIGFLFGFIKSCSISSFTLDISTLFFSMVAFIIIGSLLGFLFGNMKEIEIISVKN